MLISQLLESHAKEVVENSLSDNLGDAMLLKENRIYAIIRSQLMHFKFELSSDFSANYTALSLSQLEVIMAQKKIPYFNNVAVLYEIERLIPRTTTWAEIEDNLKGNYLFHESCHAVARSLAQKHFSEGHSKSTPVEHKLLKCLLEESFANACELLGIHSVESGAHRIFYEINSYIFRIDDRSNLKRMVDDFGLKFCIYFFTLAYLHANFLYQQMDEKSLQRVLLLAAGEAESKAILTSNLKMKALRSLAKIAFQLNPQFIKMTSGFFLRLSGISANPKKDLGFDFLTVIEKESAFSTWLADLSNLFGI